MDILEKGELFSEDEDGEPVFSHSVVVYRDSKVLKIGKLEYRVFTHGPIDFSSMCSNRIPLNEVYPLYFDHLTRCEARETEAVFIKRPSLLSYVPGTGTDIARLLLREAEFGEVLRKNPHPNIAFYLGCDVQDGHILGLCWQNYKHSLEDMIEHLSSASEVNLWMNEIVKGIKHIHSLGFCHNDIKPNNIRFADDHRPVIIDFDSCQPIGNVLTLKCGTTDWCDTTVSRSLPENDFFGIRTLEKFLLARLKHRTQSSVMVA